MQPKTTILNTEQLWNLDLIKKYDLSGPRYTSYPTAAQFQPNSDMEQWIAANQKGNRCHTPLSLYFHIPFCETVCYYCACNKIITANKKRASSYLHALYKEISLQAEHISQERQVTQLHWGGGTPTYINDSEMTQLMHVTQKHFNLSREDTREYSIEIHPASVDKKRINHLAHLGFNRLSMGIQDFDPRVQNAVNRFNSEKEVKSILQAVRKNPFKSISMDLIYGLPLQTAQSFSETLNKVIDLAPDRLSLFNYAHMPHLFKTQKQIDATQLPEPQEKLVILHNSINTLLEAGYEYIGMDHFAKPNDELALAQHNGELHRNFQGYATQSACDLLAFGVSSINSLDSCFIQNHKDIESYVSDIEKNKLPLAKIISLDKDDKIRQHVINEIICNFTLTYEKIEKAYNINFTQYFSNELVQLKGLHEDQLITLTENALSVNPAGRLLVRRICMAFDAYINTESKTTTNKFSRII